MFTRQRNLALAVDNTQPYTVRFDDEGADEDGIRVVTDDDGGATVTFDDDDAPGGIGGVDVSQLPHDVNLAEYLDEHTLTQIGEQMAEGLEADLDSRKEFDELSQKGAELLGFSIEDREFPFKGAAGVFHPVMTEAVIRFQATARGEMLPAGGPVREQILGDVTPDLEAKAERKKDYLNYFLTEVDEGYYPEFDKMLMHVGVSGNAFKKVYRDPLRKRPASKFLTADRVVVNYGATSLADADRIHELVPTSRAELIRMQLAGVYRKVDLGAPAEDEPSDVKQTHDKIDGRHQELAEGDENYQLVETHANVNVEVAGLEHLGPDGQPSDLPLPYVVTWERETRKVVGLYRNWAENDPNYATGPARQDYYVHYGLIPGLGFYYFGFAHLLGGIAKGSTMLLRQLIDSGTLANFPGGLRVKGMKVDDSSITIGPCEFKEIDTGGLPIQDAVMPLPYKDPSEVLVQLLSALVEAAQRLGATADMQVGEGRQDAPVGTTVALIEQAMKIMSAIHKRLHVSHRKELRLLSALFGREPGARYPYMVEGRSGAALAEDFTDGMVDTVPVSDPNLPTQAQRLALADAELKLAQQAPQIHDLRTAYAKMYRTLGLSKAEIDTMMPPPQQAMPMDPVSEFQAVLAGKPIAVGHDQNHDAHIAVHMAQLQIPDFNKTPAYQPMLAHAQEHLGMKFRVLAEMALGQPLPQPGAPLPPQLEAQISMAVARSAEQILAQFRSFMDPEHALQHEANQLKAKELEIKDEENKRKAVESEAQNRTELVKTSAMIQNDAAERASRERQALLRVEAEKVKARGNLAVAGIQGVTDRAQIRHETVRSVLDHNATVAGHRTEQRAQRHETARSALEHAATMEGHKVAHRQAGVEEKRLPIEKTQAEADLVAAKKPNPKPAAAPARKK
jgi:hypothetical protein